MRSDCANPCRSPGPYRFHHRPLPRLSGAAVLHRFDRGLPAIAVMGSHTRATGATVKDSNDKPPYRHWHTVSAACGKVTLARPCKVPGDIDPIEHNPVVRCQHCEDTRQNTSTRIASSLRSLLRHHLMGLGDGCCSCRSDRSCQACACGINRIAKPESAGALCDLRLDYACTHGDRGKQGQIIWQQAKAQMATHR